MGRLRSAVVLCFWPGVLAVALVGVISITWLLASTRSADVVVTDFQKTESATFVRTRTVAPIDRPSRTSLDLELGGSVLGIDGSERPIDVLIHGTAATSGMVPRTIESLAVTANGGPDFRVRVTSDADEGQLTLTLGDSTYLCYRREGPNAGLTPQKVLLEVESSQPGGRFDLTFGRSAQALTFYGGNERVQSSLSGHLYHPGCELWAFGSRDIVAGGDILGAEKGSWWSNELSLSGIRGSVRVGRNTVAVADSDKVSFTFADPVEIAFGPGAALKVPLTSAGMAVPQIEATSIQLNNQELVPSSWERLPLWAQITIPAPFLAVIGVALEHILLALRLFVARSTRG